MRNPEGGSPVAWNKHEWENSTEVDLKREVWSMWIELI